MGADAASSTLIALAMVLVATLFNLSGTRMLARIAMLGFLCEIAGAIMVGGYLLLFHRVQPVTALVTDYGFAQHGSFAPAFLASCLVGAFCCFGFEACGNLAEETPDPGRRIPLAMRMTIYIGIAVTIFSVAGLLLAIPDMRAAVSGEMADPVASILMSAFGPAGYKVILAIILVSFVSCVLSLQAAVSRLVFSYARDDMIFGSELFSRLSEGAHVPAAALILAGLIPSAIIAVGYLAQDALTAIVSFAAVGIYIAFQLVVLAALYARIRGWSPQGKFRLGRFAWPVNVLALVYGLAAIANMLWPRATPGDPWYLTYGQPLMVAGVVGAGLFYMLLAHPEQHGNAPAGDAWLLFGH